MFPVPSERVLIAHGRRRARQPMTLSWAHFVLIVSTLCGLTTTIVLGLFQNAVGAVYSRLTVRQYEQAFGFKVGLLYGYPPGAKDGMWGLASVTPGGRMDRAGARAGDLIFTHHGTGFAELHWVIDEALAGRTGCLVLVNIADLRENRHYSRDVCVSADITLPATVR